MGQSDQKSVRIFLSILGIFGEILLARVRRLRYVSISCFYKLHTTSASSIHTYMVISVISVALGTIINGGLLTVKGRISERK